MIAHNLGNQRQPKARAIRLCRDKRVKQMRAQIFRHPISVIAHTKFKRQAHTLLHTRHRKAHTWAERRGDNNLRLIHTAQRFTCILDQVDKHLHQLISISINRRQRWVIILNNAHLGRKAVLRNPLHMIQHHVNVHRLAVNRTLIGKHFHPVHQLHDPVRLLHDKTGQ